MRAILSAALAAGLLLAPMSAAAVKAPDVPEYKGKWKVAKSYKKGALVKYGNAIWVKDKKKKNKRCGTTAPGARSGCWSVFVQNGANGSNGKNGTNGRNGTPGATGAPGPEGPQGSPGLSNYSMVTKDYLWSGSEGYTYTDVNCPAGTSVLGVAWQPANPSGLANGVMIWASFNSSPAGARLNIVNKVAPLAAASFTVQATCATVN